jgi:hypothetical protein
MNVSDITIRPARQHDTDALTRLAQLDSQPSLPGLVLLAEICGEPVAAIDTATGRTIADPFTPTADVVELLRLRACGARARRRAATRLIPRLA